MKKSPSGRAFTGIRWSRAIPVAAITAVLAIVAACSQTPQNGPALYEKMVKAYGGSDNLDRVTSFSGKGFMKQIPMIHVARSYAFDIYQDDLRFKTKMMNVDYGRLIGLRMTVNNGEESFGWTDQEGEVNLADWEKRGLKYRFPYALKWIGESGVETSIVEMEGDPDLMALRVVSGSDVLTYGIEKGSWLLSEMHFSSEADSTFLFREKYSDYIDLEGTWFPSRFTAYYRNNRYYEYYLVKIDLGAEFPDGFFSLLPADTTGIYRPEETPSEPAGQSSGS